MSMRHPLWLAALLLAVACASAAGKPGAAKPSGASAAPQPLNQDAVRLFYNDGDFDRAIAILEEFQKTHKEYTREESLMVYKYLGVMYSADPGSREKGKTYFYKLLQIDPEAKILDMYVSIVVQEIFKNTLDELMGSAMSPEGVRRAKAGQIGAADPAPAAPARPERSAELKSGKSPTWYWWLGGVGIAAAAAAGYYAYSQQEEDGGKAPDTHTPITF